MLKIKNVSKAFGSKKVLDNVSLEVKPGGIAVLLGSSGVGKSTLLRLLNNFETLDQGSVELDGKPINLANVNKDHTVAMIFQQFNLFDHLTVEENITLALEVVQKKSKTESKKIAQSLLTKFGLSDKAQDYPSQLSGGQKQRLAIARTLALKPTIICFDEPTSALDPLLTTHVANSIQELAHEGYIILIASHDVALLDKLACDIYLMEHGKIIETVSSAQFRANRDAYPRLARFVAGSLD
jgi:polar amino acid transport system ATP-binding protein